jgi:hypothetical protein
MTRPSDEPRLQRPGGLAKYRTFWLAGLLIGFISLGDLAFHPPASAEPSTGLALLGGFGMLGIIMRLRQRHGG